MEMLKTSVKATVISHLTDVINELNEGKLDNTTIQRLRVLKVLAEVYIPTNLKVEEKSINLLFNSKK